MLNLSVTEPTIILCKPDSGKESGFNNLEELCSRHWRLRNVEIEICILVDDMVMCPALFKPTLFKPANSLFHHFAILNNSKCKRKFSNSRISYYANTMATKQLFLLSGDVETNPGWQGRLSAGPRKVCSPGIKHECSTHLYPQP